MRINRTSAILAGLVILLIVGLAFLIGQRSSGDAEPDVPSDPADAAPIDDNETQAAEEPALAVRPRALPIRIGRDGPDASACDRVGRVVNLPGGDDDFLSVREAPTTDAKRIGQLDGDTPFYVCDRQGDWFGIVYLSDGTLGDPDECGLANSVGSPRAYSGACLTGWVHSGYVDGSGVQDSDEPHVEEDELANGQPQSRTVQVSATGSSQGVAATNMTAKAEREHDKPVGQRPDGNRAACRETGDGEARWTCTATYTITN